MATKTVYNWADGEALDAHEDQVTAGLFHIPAGATAVKPPLFNAETETRQFIDDKWVVENIPEPEPEPEPPELTYADKRASEYPSIAELTIALYDDADKSALVAKRNAVKLKYPKPS